MQRIQRTGTADLSGFIDIRGILLVADIVPWTEAVRRDSLNLVFCSLTVRGRTEISCLMMAQVVFFIWGMFFFLPIPDSM